MTKDELIATVSQKSNCSAEQTAQVLDILVTEIKTQLTKGEKVNISGFGTFMISNRKTKNSAEAQPFPHFKAGSNLKKAIS